MSAGWDPSKPFSAELHVIRRLSSSLCGAGGRADAPLAGRRPPPAERATLAPLRVDIPLLDPCCGQLSAGAEVELGVKGRPNFIDFHHVASALWVPRGGRERPQTAPNSSGICEDLREDKAWNSRRIPDAALRARLSGSSSPVQVHQPSLRTTSTAASHSGFPNTHTGAENGFSSDLRLRTEDSLAVRNFRYTSATQRSYEEVGWDAKLPRRLKAPGTTLEERTDPVSDPPSFRRYSSRPQLWQCCGAEWNRRQLRSRNDARKPISFCSGCPRSGQIPLYTGSIGSENMDHIDNLDEGFHPLTLKRSVVPPYVPTARRTTIPGYTGKAASAAPAASSPAHSSGTMRAWQSPARGHAGPLSRAVTTVAPSNPFLRAALPASRTNT